MAAAPVPAITFLVKQGWANLHVAIGDDVDLVVVLRGGYIDIPASTPQVPIVFRLFGTDAVEQRDTRYFRMFQAKMMTPLASIDGEWEIKAKLVCNDGASVHNLPEQLRFELVRGMAADQPTIIAASTIPNEFRKFNRGLSKYQFPAHVQAHPSHLNMLLFGPAGVGKSSFLMSLLTALHRGPEVLYHAVPELASGPDVTHGTSVLRKTSDRFDRLGMHFAVWDTWGVRADGYNHRELRYIIDGRLPEGFSSGTPRALSMHRSCWRPIRSACSTLFCSSSSIRT